MQLIIVVPLRKHKGSEWYLFLLKLLTEVLHADVCIFSTCTHIVWPVLPGALISSVIQLVFEAAVMGLTLFQILEGLRAKINSAVFHDNSLTGFILRSGEHHDQHKSTEMLRVHG